jgi:ribokinase
MMANQARPILVVGSINMDLVSTTERIPLAGETVLGSSFETHPGGKGANQAVAVARLGYPVRMIGMLGSDGFAEQLRAHMGKAGVDLAGVGELKGSSGTASIIVSSSGENCIVVTPAANSEVSPEYLNSHVSLIREAAMVLAQLEIPIETVEHLAELCSQERVPLVLDPAPARPLSPELLKRVHWFTPNETEAAFYAGGVDGRDSGEMARALLKQGPAGLILKLGARGAYLSAGSVDKQLDAPAVHAVDTTAAGDCFNGAFAVGLMLGKDPVESARFAVAAASISVTRPGAQSSMPTLAEVNAMLGGSRG